MKKTLLLCAALCAALAMSAAHAVTYDPGPSAEATVAKSTPYLNASAAPAASYELTATPARAVLAVPDAANTSPTVTGLLGFGIACASAIATALVALHIFVPKSGHRLHEHPGEGVGAT